MRCRFRHLTAPALLAGALLGVAAPCAQAQQLSADYQLTVPSLLPELDLGPSLPVRAWGRVRLAAGGAATGTGLSLEAGEKWFARAGIGRSLDTDLMGVGGGYRFSGREALSMQLTRQLGQERLGLAVRYDYRQAYLRLSYEQPLRTPGTMDRVRFSAGFRF